FPSISALCRGANFAPRLERGDFVVYLTTKGRYLNDTVSGWRLIAVLRVLKRFNSHRDAAAWYKARSVPLPSNCVVAGNPPKSLRLTDGGDGRDACVAPARAIRLWDEFYG